MIGNDFLEWFILAWAHEIPSEFGRPTSGITPLWLAAKEKFGEFDMDQVLAALYNLKPDHAEISKWNNVGHKISFERNNQWKNFFATGPFNIKVLAAGIIRLQTLSEQMQKEMPLPTPPAPNPIGFTA